MTKSSAGLVRIRLEPKGLRHEHVADHQQPLDRRSTGRRCGSASCKCRTFVAVPRHECFDDVAVRDHQAGREHHLRAVFEMADGDEILQAVDFAHWESPASAPSRSRKRSRRRRSTAGKSSNASRARSRPRSRARPRCAPRAPAASPVRPAADKPFDSASNVCAEPRQPSAMMP